VQKAVRYTFLAAALSLLVGAAGSWVAGPESRQAIWIGVAIALVFQLVLFVLLFVVTLAKHPMLAYGLSMLGRFFIVGTVALFWAPWANLPAAPLLFSLVAVFFVTTLIEPLFLLSKPTAR
jgi:hypothetical protein